MIVSALLTSVGINLGLCFMFITLYSVLRKQPCNIHVYAPRLVAEGKIQRRSRFNIDRLLPTPGWVSRAWNLSEDELLATTGLDAVVFMRIITFSIKLFSVAGIVGMFILLPINYLGDQINETDFYDLQKKSLDLFSISNVEDGSKRLWIHFCAVYFITAVVCYLLYYEYKYISSKRIACFLSSEPLPHQFTILVRGIPLPTSGTLSDSVESFFTEYHSSTYLSHLMVRRTSKLSDVKSLYERVTHSESNAPAKQKFQRDGFFGLFGRKDDTVDRYERKLGDLEENVSQSNGSLAGKEVPAAFVSFKTCYGAAIASDIKQSDNPTEWVTEQAPEPHDVFWPFFSSSFLQRWVSKLVVIFSVALLTLLFLVPVAFVQGLTNLRQLETFFPFLKGILSIAFVSQVITGYLPSLILQLFLYMVPPIMKIFSSIQGYISHSEIEKSACNKVLWFTVWNIFFATVLSGSLLEQVNTILEPKDIPMKLAQAVPGQASFYITYVVTTGWTSLSSEIFRIVPLLCNLFCCSGSAESADDEFAAPSFAYHINVPKILFFGLLGISYVILAPLILPFLLVYYCLGYIIYRNQLLNVYEPKYETGGRFWPIVHNSTIFSLLLMQIIAVGLFGLKKLPIAAILTVPILVLTLLFNQYCRKRFLPVFMAYSAESLIKKDRQDQNDPEMANFLERLVTAYRDPGLLPVQSSGDVHEHHTPLLSHPSD